MYVLCFVTFLSALILKISCTTPPSTSSEDSSRQADQYASEMVKNDKVRDVYVNCLLDKGPCSSDAAHVKKMLPEAVERGCAKCTEMHKKMIEKMMLHLQQKQPEILQQVTAKFDPKGEFMKTFLLKLQRGALNRSNESGQQYDQNAPGGPTGLNQNQQSTQPSQTQQSRPIKN